MYCACMLSMVPKEPEEATDPEASFSLNEQHLTGEVHLSPSAAPTIKGASVEYNRKAYNGSIV